MIERVSRLGPEHFLRYNANEHPLVVQLGGNEPDKMAKASIAAAAMGYDEININCGCPSPKVKEGSFGAVLMLKPQIVVDIVTEVRKAVTIPVTVKCRLGVDDHDSYEELTKFVGTVSAAGVKHFVIHARKALLSGLDPKANRTVPPLKYDWVYKLAVDFPALSFSINGGLQTIESVAYLMRLINR